MTAMHDTPAANESTLLDNIVHTGLLACDICGAVPAPHTSVNRPVCTTCHRALNPPVVACDICGSRDAEYDQTSDAVLCDKHLIEVICLEDEVGSDPIPFVVVVCPVCGGAHPAQQCERILTELHKPVVSPPRTDVTYEAGAYTVIVRGRVVARCGSHAEAVQVRDAVLHDGNTPGDVVRTVCRCEGASGDGIHECATFACWLAFHNGMMLDLSNPDKASAEALLVEFAGHVGPRAWAA